MTITKQAGYIIVSFSEEDWNFRHGKEPGGVQAVISGIKTLGHISKNPTGFQYDPETKEWRIGDTPHNRKHIETLKEWYLVDKDQLGMFG